MGFGWKFCHWQNRREPFFPAQAELVESFGRVAQETNKENAKTMAKVPQKLP